MVRPESSAARSGGRGATGQKRFERLAKWAARAAGHPYAFFLAVATVLVWLATGPIFHFSDTWQLVINTGTTIVTFLMVFLIQHTQNRDTVAMQLKLDELIRAVRAANNEVLDLEEEDEEQLEALRRSYEDMAVEAREQNAATGKKGLRS